MPRYRSFGALDDPQLEDGDRAFLRMNTRLRPHQLEPGEVAESLNGRMDRNGSWVPRKAVKNLSGVLSTEGFPLLLPFHLIDTGGGATVSAAALSSNVVTLTVTGHGLTGTAYLEVKNLGFTTTDPNGAYSMTVTDVDTLTYSLTGANETFVIGGDEVVLSELDDTAVTIVYGSCLFSDPSDDNEEYIIIALNTKAVAVKLADGTTTDIDYPGSSTVDGTCDLIQAFAKVYLHRATTDDPGLVSWQWNGTLSGSPAFTAVTSGAYGDPTYYAVTSGAVTIADGVCTVAYTGTVPLIGDKLTVIANQDAVGDLDLAVGEEFEVTAATASTSFAFFCGRESHTAHGAALVEFRTRASLSTGFIYMPAPPWSVYHQRRFWMPYRYDSEDSFADRGTRDEIIASDILDADTYDPISNQFRVTAGISDYTVALHPYVEDNLLVFNRNSIHVIKGVSGSLVDTATVGLTSEIGCLARQSVVTYANQIIFLSDNGVYAVQFVDEYNLRGTDIPLSEPIQSTIDRINQDLAPNAIGIYHDNRYWLAVALDSSAGANDATGNNTILVYSILNQGWESIDTVDDSRWDVVGLHIGRAEQRNKLYAVIESGGVHEIDATDEDRDDVALTVNASATDKVKVSSKLLTRQYDMKTMERKRYTDIDLQAESSAGSPSAFTVNMVTENPDLDSEVTDTVTNLGSSLAAGEDASIRSRTGGLRGQGAQLRITPSEGRPVIRSMKTLATVTNRSDTSLT